MEAWRPVCTKEPHWPTANQHLLTFAQEEMLTHPRTQLQTWMERDLNPQPFGHCTTRPTSWAVVNINSSFPALFSAESLLLFTHEADYELHTLTYRTFRSPFKPITAVNVGSQWDIFQTYPSALHLNPVPSLLPLRSMGHLRGTKHLHLSSAGLAKFSRKINVMGWINGLTEPLT